MKKFTLFLILAAAMTACSPKVTVPASESSSEATEANTKALRSFRVYQMTGDYAQLVPITLDATGTKVVSYPDPADITPSQRPVALTGGWYLDRRGINANTAFTTYTYDEYAALKQAPSAEELLAHIQAKNAISAIWDCGKKRLTVSELNTLIENGFTGCTRIK